MKVAMVSVPVIDPSHAHEIYTTKLGFHSKKFDAEAMIAVVASPESFNETSILLEPCQGSFAEDYQRAAYAANLPIMVFSTTDLATELERLASAGVKLRPDLERVDWGLVNLFEDGCGNLLMLEEIAEQ